MEANKLYFEGIILQPISRAKSPWLMYDKNEQEFLDFFQTKFIENIQNDFNVRHNTENFSDYLLIPYFTEEQKCFGAYHIKKGSKSSLPNYTCKYEIDYLKSFNFKEIETKQNMMGKADSCGAKFVQSGSVNYYKLDKPSMKFKQYIIDLCLKESIE